MKTPIYFIWLNGLCKNTEVMLLSITVNSLTISCSDGPGRLKPNNKSGFRAVPERMLDLRG